MKREIKFRGQLLDSNKWVYGSFVQERRRYGSLFSILSLAEDEESEDEKHQVYFPTVTQFTGLRDKNGKEIYEGDFINERHLDGEVVGLGCVVWDNSLLCWSLSDSGCLCDAINIEVIGNIYETPELLQS